MTYADATERTRLIAGLRDLADFLDARPLLPAPLFTDVMVFPPQDGDEAMRAEIDRVAALLNAQSSTAHGRYEAGRDFGPVSYRAVAVLADARARWDTVTKVNDILMPLISADTHDKEATGPEIDLGPSCACGARVENGATTCRKCTNRIRWRRRKARRNTRNDEAGLDR